MINLAPSMSGPIPGENFTSDTKNYPWHRPPEFNDIDKAIENVAQKITDEETASEVLTLFENGFTVVTVTDMLLTHGIGKGKWTPDMALLMAGPVAHILCMMCEADNVPYELGTDDKSSVPTKAYFNSINKDQKKTQEQAEELQEAVNPAPKPGSFMGGM